MFGSNLLNGASSGLAGAATKGLTFSKILGGAGKALNFANKAIPMYYQIKPMLGNAKTLINMYSAMKDDGTSNNPKVEEKKEPVVKNEKINKANVIKTNTKNVKVVNDSLTFFQ